MQSKVHRGGIWSCQGILITRPAGFSSVLLATLALAFVVATPRADAFVFDWADFNWTPANTHSQTFTNVYGSGVNITINTSYKPTWDGYNYGNPYRTNWPNDANVGTLSGETENSNVLWQAIADGGHDSTTDYVSVLITFSVPVANVSLKIEDIDSARQSGNEYRDEIDNIRALAGDGTTVVYATGAEYAGDGDTQRYTITGSGANLAITANNIVGTGENRSLGADTGGDARILFGPQAVTAIYYRYGNAQWSTGTAEYNPTLQWTGPSLLDFQVIPEPSMALGGGLFLGLSIAASLLTRALRKTARVPDLQP